MELRMSLETDAVEPLGDFDAFFHATSSGSRGPQRSSRGMPAQARPLTIGRYLPILFL